MVSYVESGASDLGRAAPSRFLARPPRQEHPKHLFGQYLNLADLEESVARMPAGFLMVNSHGRILAANEAANRILGYSGEDLIAMDSAVCLPVLTNALVGHALPPSFRSTFECPAWRHNAEAFTAHVCCTAIDTGGEPKMAVCFTDARDWSATDDTLSKSLAAAVGLHEARNLVWAAELLVERLLTHPEVQALPEAKSLLLLTQSLAAVTAPQRPNGSSGPSTDIYDLMSRFRTTMAPVMAEHCVSARYSIPEGLPPLRIAPESLLRVLLNLARNSVQAVVGRPKPRFSLSAQLEDGFVSIKIRDSGPGLPTRTRQFRPYVGDDGACHLGLYISKCVIRNAGGELNWQRRPRGGYFTLDIPIVQNRCLTAAR